MVTEISPSVFECDRFRCFTQFGTEVEASQHENSDSEHVTTFTANINGRPVAYYIAIGKYGGFDILVKASDDQGERETQLSGMKKILKAKEEKNG